MQKTKDLVKKFREDIPGITIRTSLIVGYPGETEKEFKELLDFIEESKFDRLGVFTYSDEEGTYASHNLEDNIPEKVKQERYDKIMMIQQDISLEKNKALLGKEDVVVIDKSSKDEGWSIARSYRDAPEIDNYVKINELLDVGSFYTIKVKEAYEYDVLGEIVEK